MFVFLLDIVFLGLGKFHQSFLMEGSIEKDPESPSAQDGGASLPVDHPFVYLPVSNFIGS